MVKEFLKEEPILKEEFDDLRQSLEYFSDNFSKEEFEAKCDEYLDFLELLNEIIALPKNESKYGKGGVKKYFLE